MVVQLTDRQFEALEELRKTMDDSTIVVRHAERINSLLKWTGKHVALNTISLNDLTKAILEGAERETFRRSFDQGGEHPVIFEISGSKLVVNVGGKKALMSLFELDDLTKMKERYLSVAGHSRKVEGEC